MNRLTKEQKQDEQEEQQERARKVQKNDERILVQGNREYL
jgi:hypothetical protein